MPELKDLHDHATELTEVTGVVVEIIERENRVYVFTATASGIQPGTVCWIISPSWKRDLR